MMKIILPCLISEEQTGFSKGRQILDNVIMAHEITHSLKTLKKAGMIMQLDLSKLLNSNIWRLTECY